MNHTVSIDLYSDTVTRPTARMRQAMAQAEVGDEKERADPTVNLLTERVAELLGKEDAIFLPSGTMCNQVAFRVWCRPGDEIIMDTTAHTRHFETGGPAALSGASTYTVEGRRGVFDAAKVADAIRPVGDDHFPRSRVVLVEQTSNMGGGTIWPIATVKEVCDLAHGHGLACHMDGARLLNAVVATAIPASEWAAHFDSIWIDFSKGLGAPVGAALAGSEEFIRDAWRWKLQFGGGMRQAGIIAAGALYALDHHVERLAEDHAHASVLAEGLQSIGGITVEPVETNMVFFDVSGLGMTAEIFHDRLLQQSVRVSYMEKSRVRAVTHLDISRAQVLQAIDIIRELAEGRPSPGIRER
ncbi:aminotransferase class V-fold PLP-dependent enzyme [Candidatus Fermentibacteria bacterium]|nr:aminotransferase class V-fold PLP-dependent enzyme [Candidatus Fermentibacteria bacterium]